MGRKRVMKGRPQVMGSGRTRSDAELKAIIDTYNESERTGLMFGMLPFEKTPQDLSNKDVARMMELNPKGHYS